MRILGLDYGSKTIGVAVSDPFLITAFGLETIKRPEEGAIKKSLARLGEIINEYGIETIVLGYPKHLNNTESERCVKTVAFKSRLTRNFKNVSVILWDERLTTVSAGKELKSAGIFSKKTTRDIDTVSAVLILQSYLEYLSKGDIIER